MSYDASYYDWNKQARDRPALWFYARTARRYFPAGRVLDFGSGTGFLLRRLSRYFTVNGFEVSVHAKQRSESLHEGIKVFDKLDDIPLASYTGITSLHVFEHINDADLKNILTIFRKVLLPGGRILCVVPELNGRGHTLKGDDWCGFQDATHINLKTVQGWSRFFEENGFLIIKTGSDGLWNFPYTSLPRYLDMFRYAVPTIFQFVAGRLLLPVSSGESAIFILERLP